MKTNEPLIEDYTPGCYAVEYAVKTFQTDEDRIFFSTQLTKAILGLK